MLCWFYVVHHSCWYKYVPWAWVYAFLIRDHSENKCEGTGCSCLSWSLDITYSASLGQDGVLASSWLLYCFHIYLSLSVCVCMHLCFCFFPLIPMILLKLQKNVRDSASNNSPGCFDGWISQTSNVLDIPVSLFVLQSGCCVWMPDAVCWGLTAWMWLL